MNMKKQLMIAAALTAVTMAGCHDQSQDKSQAQPQVQPQAKQSAAPLTGGMVSPQMPAMPGGSDPHAGISPQAMPAGVTSHKGKVVSTMDAAGYTYVEVEEKGQKIWVAAAQ